MLFSVLVFLLVLSLLVFVHELGHFLAAKACNIYVDRFSLGMPPRVAGFRWGETDYCISALPIGGYVKMAGQEDAPLSDEEREQDYGNVPPDRWFNNKPVWQRFIVILAGPFMNVVLAVALYAILAAVGADVPEYNVVPRIGQVEPDSPASGAPLYVYEDGAEPSSYTGTPDATGWQTGDLILSLDGRSADNLGDLAINAILGGEDTVHYVLLERTNPDDSTTTYVSPLKPTIIGEEEHPRFGVAPFDTAQVGEVLPDSPAADAGLQPGDIIRRADGAIVDWPTFTKLVSEKEAGAALALVVDRESERLHLTLKPETIGRIKGLVAGVPREGNEEDLEAAAPVVLGITEDTLSEYGIQRKDVIAAVDGEAVTMEEFRELERSKAGETVKLTLERPAILLGLLQRAETKEIEVPIEPIRAIGVVYDPVMVFHRVPAGEVLPEAFRQSYLAIERTVLTLKALVTADVSPKALGGPLMILDVTATAARAGWAWLIKITAFISINLAVFNLLPLPVLDGGLFVIHAIEGIRRKPLSLKVQERFQQAGLLLIISLMLFVTWNDIWRWIDNLRP
jgi:regulator of sigma E protease